MKIESEGRLTEFIATALPSYTALEIPMAKRNGDVSMAVIIFPPTW